MQGTGTGKGAAGKRTAGMAGRRGWGKKTDRALCIQLAGATVKRDLSPRESERERERESAARCRDRNRSRANLVVLIHFLTV